MVVKTICTKWATWNPFGGEPISTSEPSVAEMWREQGLEVFEWGWKFEEVDEESS